MVCCIRVISNWWRVKIKSIFYFLHFELKPEETRIWKPLFPKLNKDRNQEETNSCSSNYTMTITNDFEKRPTNHKNIPNVYWKAHFYITNIWCWPWQLNYHHIYMLISFAYLPLQNTYTIYWQNLMKYQEYDLGHGQRCFGG